MTDYNRTSCSPLPTAAPMLCVNEKLSRQFSAGIYAVHLQKWNHAHYSRLHSPGSQIMQVECTCAIWHIGRSGLIAGRKKKKTVLASEHNRSWRRACSSISAMWGRLLCAASLNFSSVRVASVPPRCSQTLRRSSTTSDVVRSSRMENELRPRTSLLCARTTNGICFKVNKKITKREIIATEH